jgi:hypothetical protein
MCRLLDPVLRKVKACRHVGTDFSRSSRQTG